MLEVGKNSFLTLEEAEGIVANELFPDSEEAILWEGLNDTSKEIICKMGTMSINKLAFKGTRDVGKYNLKFPRYINGVEVIPDEIKIASVINGLMSKLDSGTQEVRMLNRGVIKMSVGPSSVELDKSILNGARVYTEARAYIEHLIVKQVSI